MRGKIQCPPFHTVHWYSSVLGAQDLGCIKPAKSDSNVKFTYCTSLLFIPWAIILFLPYSYKLKQTHFSPSESFHFNLTVILTISHISTHAHAIRTKLSCFYSLLLLFIIMEFGCCFFLTKQQFSSAN